MTGKIKPGESGFCSILKSDGWQIASITYSSQYSKEGFTSMKRHLTSDETFILVRGNAMLHTVEDGKLISEDLEKETVYCVYKNTWHYLEISEDALLFVTENSKMLPQESETEDLECLMQK